MTTQSKQSHRSFDARTARGSICLSVLLAIAPAVVIAGSKIVSTANTATTVVSLTDFDLMTPAGLLAAQQRLASAARLLCRQFSDTNRASDYATTNACYRETLADAMRRFSAQLAKLNAKPTDLASNNH